MLSGAGSEHALTDSVDRYDLVWETPSRDSSGSMPLGNGDIGLNVWAEQGGDLLFYISKTDAWDEACRLVKLGRVRISLTPNPFVEGCAFRQYLCLGRGEIEIRAGEGGSETTLRVWVDACQPVIHVDVEGSQSVGIRVSLELWRTAKRELEGKEAGSAYGIVDGPDPVVEMPDTVVPDIDNRIVWYHRNTTSIWPDTLRLQGMGEWIARDKDPLLNRTFGGIINADGFLRDGSTALRSSGPVDRCEVSIHIHTAQTDSPEEWVEQAEELGRAAGLLTDDGARKAHLEWWKDFWQRSWIRVSEASGSPAPTASEDAPRASTFEISQGYALQRFISACGGRGEYPIKFNGSIFTSDSTMPSRPYNADYRRWGGPYWFQNTRLIYWPMLASGDYDLMRPLFSMYLHALPFLKCRTRAYSGHEGACFPETMYFWGAYTNDNYGWDRAGKPISLVENTCIRFYYTGTLELLALMLDYYEYTLDATFVTDELLPLCIEFLAFWDEHWTRDEQGYLLMDPSQALETYQRAVNPACDIAGLQWVLDRLLALPSDLVGTHHARWQRLRDEVPSLPTATEDGRIRLLPALRTTGGPSNYENPELYAVFPFRIYGAGKPGLDIGRLAFSERGFKEAKGWCQDDVQAAFLGLTDEAQDLVSSRFALHDPNGRFPAFWGPNADWVPDQCHGGNGMMALETMLLQADGDRILLFPAWPRDWDVEFKLHAPLRTTVEAIYRGGTLELLKVLPESRAKDVVSML